MSEKFDNFLKVREELLKKRNAQRKTILRLMKAEIESEEILSKAMTKILKSMIMLNMIDEERT